MSVNSLTFSNGSLLLSSINFSLPFGLKCLILKPTFSSVYITSTIISTLLLLPVCFFILCYGLQRWRQQCFSSTASTTSHSNSFTYNLVTMEIFYVFGCILFSCGVFRRDYQILRVGIHFFYFTWYGETFFHVLTCVEHYLAVVHPITYRSLRQERGIRIRNIMIGCIWLLCFGGTSLITLDNVPTIMVLCLLIPSLIINSFCSLSVLCVLIRPGPGKQSREREKVDQSKQRAFYIIMAILGVLLLRCVFTLVWIGLSVLNEENNKCVVVMCQIWINIPSSLLLSLLFLHRAGMLVCCKNNVK